MAISINIERLRARIRRWNILSPEEDRFPPIKPEARVVVLAVAMLGTLVIVALSLIALLVYVAMKR